MKVFPLFLVFAVIIGGVISDGNPQMTSADEEPSLYGGTVQIKRVIKRSGPLKLGWTITKAGISLGIGISTSEGTFEFQNKLMITVNEIRHDIAQLGTKIQTTAMDFHILNNVDNDVSEITDLLASFANPNLDKDTQINLFLGKMNITNEVSIMIIIQGLFSVGPSTNIFDIKMNNDQYHRFSTLEAVQRKIDSVMKLIIFSRAVEVSILGNSSTLVEFIKERWNKADPEDKTDLDISDVVAMKEDGLEKEKEKFYPYLMELYNKTSRIMEEQIANKLQENSFNKIPMLIRLTNGEVARLDGLDKQGILDEKVKRLKKHLDEMYTNDRYFVLSYQKNDIGETFWPRMKGDMLNFNRADNFYDDNESIAVFREKPKATYMDKIKKEKGKALQRYYACSAGATELKYHKNALAVFNINGLHAMATDFNYDVTAETKNATCTGYRLPFGRITRVAHTHYVIYG